MELLERPPDAAVELATPLLDERRVGDLLDEAVAEAVLRGRAPPLLDDELEALKLRQGRNEARARCYALEQRQAEVAADHGRDVEDLPRIGFETVEAGLQGLLDELGDDDPVPAGGELVPAVLAAQRAPLHEVAQRLLEEERVAAGAVRELIRDRGGQLGAGRASGEHPACLRVEHRQLELVIAVRVPPARMVAQVPGAVLAFAPVEEDEADRLLLGDRQELLQQVERRFVGPVQVLHDEAQRPLTSQRTDEAFDAVDRLPLDAVAAELSQPIRRVGL